MQQEIIDRIVKARDAGADEQNLMDLFDDLCSEYLLDDKAQDAIVNVLELDHDIYV